MVAKLKGLFRQFLKDLRSAKALGTIPQPVLVRADEAIGDMRTLG